MSNSNYAFEVSGLVWLDDDTDDWAFSLFAIHSDTEEELLEWGVKDSKDEAVEGLRVALNNYFNGI